MERSEIVAKLYHLVSAINRHDLDELVSHFHEDYESIQPVHPERSFCGRDRVRENWEWVFQRFSDFRAQVIDFAVRDCTVWTEWTWQGTAPDGAHVVVRGVMILTVDGDLFRHGKLYLEPVRG